MSAVAFLPLFSSFSSLVQQQRAGGKEISTAMERLIKNSRPFGGSAASYQLESPDAAKLICRRADGGQLTGAPPSAPRPHEESWVKGAELTSRCG